VYGNSGPCDLLLGWGGNPNTDRGQCCLPVPVGSRQVGCSRPRSFPLHAMLPTPPTFAPPRPFLEAVCCNTGEECCPEDGFNGMFPTFKCCDDDTQYCKVDTATSTGECTTRTDGSGKQDEYVPFTNKLDPAGRCPDGGSPAMLNPLQAMLCSLNTLVPTNQQQQCPTGLSCARDLSENVNNGVCCVDSKCQERTTCKDCVTAAVQVWACVCAYLLYLRMCFVLMVGVFAVCEWAFVWFMICGL
jgi:hypothetical protein